MKFEELDDLFKSATIKPSFDYIHIILALYIFGELREEEGIGRYRLKEELLIGSGTAKSLITKLNTKIHFIKVISSNNQKKGHKLTKKGLEFLNKLKKRIPIIKEADFSILKDIIIESEDINTCICVVKDSAGRITNGVAQRDAAIKIEGFGATCLVYNGMDLIFPSSSQSERDEEYDNVSDKVQKYFYNELNEINLELNDVIIIGLGENTKLARLAALNAALTLI